MNKLSQIISKLRYVNVFNKLTFEKLRERDFIFLYAGDIPFRKEYKIKGLAGLSIKRANYQTILHDICEPYPLPDNSIDAYQAEDVFEHIEYDALPAAINEISLKLTGWRQRSYPLEVLADDQVVWHGNTEKSLGYVSLFIEHPVKARRYTIRQIGSATDKDVFGQVTELAVGSAAELDLYKTPNSEQVKGELRIVEIDFLKYE